MVGTGRLLMFCTAWTDGVAQGPVEAGLLDGDLGGAHRVCPATTVGIAPTAYAIIEPENLYGRILATGTLSGSWAVSERLELYARLEAVRMDMLIAPIASDSLGPGYTALGASWRGWDGEHWALAVQGKLVLPTAFVVDEHSAPLAADAGMQAVWAPRDTLLVHAAVMPNLGLALGGGPLYPRAGVNVDVGAEWRMFRRFGVVVDGVSSFGHSEPLDYFGVGLGLRGGIGPHAGLALETRVPLVGRERALAAIDIRFDWRF